MKQIAKIVLRKPKTLAVKILMSEKARARKDLADEKYYIPVKICSENTIFLFLFTPV